MNRLPETSEDGPIEGWLVQTSNDFWRGVESTYGMLNIGHVAEYLGTDDRELIFRMTADGQLLAIPQYRGVTQWPGFQFNKEDGQPYPVMRQLAREGRTHGWSDVRLLQWLCTPNNSHFNGSRPADHIEDPAALLEAMELELNPSPRARSKEAVIEATRRPPYEVGTSLRSRDDPMEVESRDALLQSWRTWRPPYRPRWPEVSRLRKWFCVA